jgi:Tol biopolymer transport system component/tRNA A-37 threonylcarbamoyl transferase component Bud32
MTDIVRLTAALASRYTIEREVGAGGMATVYLAQDVKHHRRVAVKVLRAEIAATLGAERFSREIEVAAQLQHPHILPLLDSGEADGFYYYVMPYVEGESLRDRLTHHGELPVHDAVKVLIEVVDALAHAHAHGVVHRDIKPDNVLLSGRHALVTDFGVAKAVSEATGAHTLTSVGVALGTPAYMAPEQAAADPNLDHRVDLYAVGVLGYELLTGRPPFSGLTPQETLAAHVTQAPEPVEKRRPGLSPVLSGVLMKCLAKRPADRWQTAEELLAQLEPLATPSGGSTPTETRPIAAAQPGPRLGRLGLLGGAVLVLGAVAWFILSPPKPPQVVIGQTVPITNDPGLEIDPALSPDGSFVAYAAGPQFATRIFVRLVDGGRPVAVGDSGGAGQRWPRWSPDGRKILYVAGASVMVAPALGGQAQLVVQHRTDLTGADWSPTGREIAFASGDSLYVVGVEGGTVRPLAAVLEAHSPAWSPDGGRIAVVSGNQPYVSARQYGNLAVSTIVVVSTRGGAAIPITDGKAMHVSPIWTPGGRALLFVSNRDGSRDVYIVRVAASGKPRGAPVKITTGLRPHSITLAADGRRFAYTLFTPTANIWSLPIPRGGPVNARAAQPVTRGSQVIEDFSISEGGKWILFDSDRSGRGEVYKLSTDGGEPTQLTDAPGGNYRPVLSPDGREVAFQSQRNGNRDLFVMSAQGGPAQPLVVQPGHDNLPAWSRDGRHILFNHFGGGPPNGEYVMERSDGGWSAPRRVADWALAVATWTPDNQALVLALNDSLERIPLDTGARRVLWVKRSDADPAVGEPHYSPDGTRVYFFGLVREPDVRMGIWELPITGGPPREIVRFDDPYHLPLRGMWGTDGKRFYVTIEDRQSDVWAVDISGLP